MFFQLRFLTFQCHKHVLVHAGKFAFVNRDLLTVNSLQIIRFMSTQLTPVQPTRTRFIALHVKRIQLSEKKKAAVLTWMRLAKISGEEIKG